MPSTRSPRGWWIYILELKGGALYTGIARDLVRRAKLHLRGRASRLTRSFPPVDLRCAWLVEVDRGDAQRIERMIKGLSATAKQALVREPGGLPALIKRRLGFEVKAREDDETLGAAASAVDAARET
jgi:putative endonuclease